MTGIYHFSICEKITSFVETNGKDTYKERILLALHSWSVIFNLMGERQDDLYDWWQQIHESETNKRIFLSLEVMILALVMFSHIQMYSTKIFLYTDVGIQIILKKYLCAQMLLIL